MGRYLFTNIAFIIEMCQPQEQLKGLWLQMTIGDVNDILPGTLDSDDEFSSQVV